MKCEPSLQTKIINYCKLLLFIFTLIDTPEFRSICRITTVASSFRISGEVAIPFAIGVRKATVWNLVFGQEKYVLIRIGGDLTRDIRPSPDWRRHHLQLNSLAKILFGLLDYPAGEMRVFRHAMYDVFVSKDRNISRRNS